MAHETLNVCCLGGWIKIEKAHMQFEDKRKNNCTEYNIDDGLLGLEEWLSIFSFYILLLYTLKKFG